MIRRLVVGLLLLFTPGREVGPGSSPGAQDAMAEALAVERKAVPGLSAAERRDLDAIYERAGGAPLWIGEDRRPTAQARVGLTLLTEATTQGLDPDAYGGAELATLAPFLDASSSATTAARFDTRMTAGVLRYFRHLHLGRVDPRTLGHQLTIPVEEHDFVEIVWTAIHGGGLSKAAAGMEPPLPQYQALKSALARYRSLAATGVRIPALEGTLRPGDPFEDVATLQRLLLTLGDMPAGASLASSGTYDDATRAAVVRFQQRHGLDPDGVIGPATRQELRVPISRRVRQIELALERLRWLPDFREGRLIAVNIPMFRLWAWDGRPSADPALTMAVIVGRAMRTHTPVFVDEMEYLIFRPYWNVPASILRNESVPAIRRNPNYLARENLEIVRGQSDTGPVLAPTAENIAALGRGDVRLRQRPGPGNALGLVKFMFPNQNDVYMHDTPAPQLFARSRRDFSHGCIRVENPTALAEWVLGRNPGWAREQVVEAMNGANNRRVDLAEPIQVVIFYTTVAVLADGTVHFAPDVYGHDARLDKVL